MVSRNSPKILGRHPGGEPFGVRFERTRGLSGKEIYFLFFFKILFIFRARGREGERWGEKHQCVVASLTAPTGHLAHDPGMCPDWELNLQPFGSQAPTQSTEPHQPGQDYFFMYMKLYNV